MNGFLHERKMLIKIKNTKSESFTPKYGVPKVSPVSPVLFIIMFVVSRNQKTYKQQHYHNLQMI